MRVDTSIHLDVDDSGRFLCPDCGWPYPSALAAVTCDCDSD